MAVQLIFSFDSEDYETPAADDAEKWWAETMTRHGITACICVVGELARALRERGRIDVIEAMRRHEIAFHSDLHSAHPTWAEYLDECGWEDGVARVLREEGRGILDVREVFGQNLQGNGTAEPRIGGLVDLSHATRADGRLDLVRAEGRASRKRHRVGCCGAGEL